MIGTKFSPNVYDKDTPLGNVTTAGYETTATTCPPIQGNPSERAFPDAVLISSAHGTVICGFGRAVL